MPRHCQITNYFVFFRKPFTNSFVYISAKRFPLSSDAVKNGARCPIIIDAAHGRGAEDPPQALGARAQHGARCELSPSPDRDTGYSTTLKMLQVMREKGLVLRDDSVRPQLYSAGKTKQETQLQMLDALTKKAFGGSAVSLMMRLLSERRISAEELEEIERLIREAREGDSL